MISNGMKWTIKWCTLLLPHYPQCSRNKTWRLRLEELAILEDIDLAEPSAILQDPVLS